MNRLQRQAITVSGMLAVAIAPMTALAQRGGGNNGPRTKKFVAVTFHSPAEGKLGVEVGQAIRERMSKIFPQTQLTRGNALQVITREQINNYLTASGYPGDSAISTTDLRDIGKLMGADETLEGTATRTATGVKLVARFYYLNNIGAQEILPDVEEKDAGAAARKLVDLYAKARNELPDYESCRNALLANPPELERAKAAAKAAMLQYDKGVLPRACLMTAYQFELKPLKTRADSMIRIDSIQTIAEQVMALDANNILAIGSLADAYLSKGDTAKAIEMDVKLFKLDPGNVAQATNIVQILASAGAPTEALPIIDQLLQQNPGDASLLEMKWKLLNLTRSWKQMIATGEEMVKFDSSKADTSYFRRQISAAVQDTQPQLVLHYLAKVTTKFPKDSRLMLAYSQELRKQGQIQQGLDAAKKALAIDPKIDNGYLMVLSLYTTLGQTDSALAFGKTALAAGAPKADISGALLTLLTPAYKAAQKADSISRADSTAASPRPQWEEVYRMASVVDTIAPQSATAFFMSYSAFSVAQAALQNVAPLIRTAKPTDKVSPENQAKACAEVKVVADMLLVVDLNMGRGGAYNPNGAAAILNGVSQLKPYIDQYKKAIPCKF